MASFFCLNLRCLVQLKQLTLDALMALLLLCTLIYEREADHQSMPQNFQGFNSISHCWDNMQYKNISGKKNSTFILAHNPRFQSSVRGRQISSDLKQLNTSCIVKSRARWMHRCLLVLGYLSPLLDNPEQKHGEWYTCRDCAFPHY